MTHRGPFQPLPFCDSVILLVDVSVQAPWHRQEGDSPKGDVHPDEFPPASEPVCALSAEPENQQKTRT